MLCWLVISSVSVYLKFFFYVRTQNLPYMCDNCPNSQLDSSYFFFFIDLSPSLGSIRVIRFIFFSSFLCIYEHCRVLTRTRHRKFGPSPPPGPCWPGTGHNIVIFLLRTVHNHKTIRHHQVENTIFLVIHWFTNPVWVMLWLISNQKVDLIKLWPQHCPTHPPLTSRCSYLRKRGELLQEEQGHSHPQDQLQNLLYMETRFLMYRFVTQLKTWIHSNSSMSCKVGNRYCTCHCCLLGRVFNTEV